MSESSTKPYFIRAVHDWCTDNGYTPYLAVSVDAKTDVPREYVRNGEIVLNVGLMATSKLDLGNEFISFQARFNGVARDLFVPVEQVTAIYARETGHGMAFEVVKPLAEPADSPPVTAAPMSAAPLLSLHSANTGNQTDQPEAGSGLVEVATPSNGERHAVTESDTAKKPSRTKPTLTRIK
jgi:stringent starvation protein B